MKRAELINAVYNSMSDLVGDPVAVIGMWSNQLDRLEQELAFELPAIFIEFEDIEWRQMQGGMHTADVGIRIHLITHVLKNSNKVVYFGKTIAESTYLFSAFGKGIVHHSDILFNVFEYIDDIPDNIKLIVDGLAVHIFFLFLQSILKRMMVCWKLFGILL